MRNLAATVKMDSIGVYRYARMQSLRKEYAGLGAGFGRDWKWYCFMVYWVYI